MRSTISFALCFGAPGLLACAFFACGGVIGLGGDGDAGDDASNVPEAGGVDVHPNDASPNAPDGGGANEASNEAGGDAGDGIVYCPMGIPGVGSPRPDAGVERYAKGCTSVADCAIGYHLMDCCGSTVAVGTRSSDKARFEQDGGICGNEPLFETCDCRSQGPVIAESGQASKGGDGTDIVLRCNGNRCETYIPFFDCGFDTCDQRTQFCEGRNAGTPMPDGATPATKYQCMSIPAACAASPDCACVAGQYPPTTVASCTDTGGRVIVTLLGV